MISKLTLAPTLLAFCFALCACTSTTIDEYQGEQVVLEAQEAVVILGRRHNGDYETEPSIIECIGNDLSSGSGGMNVINEIDFLNRLYPWFEPRTAPLSPERLRRLMDTPQIAHTIEAMGLEYIIWIDGSTERGEGTGSISCAIGPGGGGCFGFGTWDDDASYEVSIWDLDSYSSVAEISASASGTSYMPAVILPVPLLARVESNVCDGIANQIKAMFNNGKPRQ
jgi:hypothetical protein